MIATHNPPPAEAEPLVPAVSARMTEDQFVAWCDEDTRAEWKNGEVVMASPASTIHVRLTRFLLQCLGLYASRGALGEVLGPEMQVRFAGLRRRRVPDVLFIARERAAIILPNHVEGAPDLIVEIVSADSEARDWREKYWEYEAAGVREYWVIDPMSQHLEAYALDSQARYQLIAPAEGAVRSTALGGFYIRPAWLWQEPLPNPLDVLRELGVLAP